MKGFFAKVCARLGTDTGGAVCRTNSSGELYLMEVGEGRDMWKETPPSHSSFFPAPVDPIIPPSLPALPTTTTTTMAECSRRQKAQVNQPLGAREAQGVPRASPISERA